MAEQNKTNENSFYFKKDNYKWMLIGLVCIVLGFILMMGSGANTTPDGKFDPNYWNEDIFFYQKNTHCSTIGNYRICDTSLCYFEKKIIIFYNTEIKVNCSITQLTFALNFLSHEFFRSYYYCYY